MAFFQLVRRLPTFDCAAQTHRIAATGLVGARVWMAGWLADLIQLQPSWAVFLLMSWESSD